MPESREMELLAEIADRAEELAALAREAGDHGLEVIAGVIRDQAGAGAWSLGTVMEADGFRPR